MAVRALSSSDSVGYTLDLSIAESDTFRISGSFGARRGLEPASRRGVHEFRSLGKGRRPAMKGDSMAPVNAPALSGCPMTLVTDLPMFSTAMAGAGADLCHGLLAKRHPWLRLLPVAAIIGGAVWVIGSQPDEGAV